MSDGLAEGGRDRCSLFWRGDFGFLFSGGILFGADRSCRSDRCRRLLAGRTALKNRALFLMRKGGVV